MRIVLDTDSKGWRTFKSYALGLVIWIGITFLCGVIAKITHWDMEFFTGWVSAAHVFTYKWNVK